MSLADLLDDAALMDDDDDDDDDDYDGGGDEEDEEEGEEVDDGEHGSSGGASSFELPAWKVTRLHPLVARGAAAELKTVLESADRLEGTERERFVERINRPDASGATPLQHAIISAAIVATVAAAGVDDPWAPDSARRIQLLLCGDAEEGVGEAGSMEVAEAGGGGDTAPAADHLRCIELLLEAGARHEQRYFGRTALHLAAVQIYVFFKCLFVDISVYIYIYTYS